MKQYFFALGLGPAFALGACGGSEPVTTVDNIVATDTTIPENSINANAATGTGVNAMTGAEVTTGQAFADAAGASDAYEVEAGKLAQQKATAQALKDFGGMMVTAHGDSTAKLKAAAAKATPTITPNPKLSAEQEANLATLRQATGADFDTAYKAQQVVAHEKTLAAVQDYAANGTVPELKGFATTIAPVVQTHLDKARGL
jgi:putative membrane protein